MSKRENAEIVAQPASGGSEGIVVGEGVMLEVRPVPWVLRAAGGAIDALVVSGAFFLTLITLSALQWRLQLEPMVVRSLMILAAVFFYLIVPIVVERLTQGRSLGKLAIGARVVRRDGGGITVWHSAVRALTGVFEIFGTSGAIALLVSFFTPRTERLGDLLAGTYSQLERVPQSPPIPSVVPRGLETWAARVDVGRMPAALDRRVAAFLRQAPSMQATSRDRVAVELARELVPFVSEVPQCSPEMFIAAVHAVRAGRDARALRAIDQRLARARSLVSRERSV